MIASRVDSGEMPDSIYSAVIASLMNCVSRRDMILISLPLGICLALNIYVQTCMHHIVPSTRPVVIRGMPFSAYRPW